MLTSGLPQWLSGKESAYNEGAAGDMASIPGVGKIPWRRAWVPTPVFLPGESHGERSLTSYTVHRVTKSQTGLKQLSMAQSVNSKYVQCDTGPR